MLFIKYILLDRQKLIIFQVQPIQGTKDYKRAQFFLIPLAWPSSAGVSKSSPPTRIRSCMGVAWSTLFDRSCKVLPGWWPSQVSWQEWGPRASSPSHISCAICLLQNRTFHFYENFEHEKITWKPEAVFMSDAPTKSRL